MKKQFSILLFLCLIVLSVTSCAKNEESQSSAQEGLAVNESADDVKIPETTTDAVDVDLTALSSTMVYAEVYNILMDPESYVGKTLKGSGVYNAFYYEEMEEYFHYFIVSDAEGCCPQGLEFIWNGGHVYPDDYPEMGDTIEVAGVFARGEDSGQTYYYIAVDDITILNK